MIKIILNQFSLTKTESILYDNFRTNKMYIYTRIILLCIRVIQCLLTERMLQNYIFALCTIITLVGMYLYIYQNNIILQHSGPTVACGRNSLELHTFTNNFLNYFSLKKEKFFCSIISLVVRTYTRKYCFAFQQSGPIAAHTVLMAPAFWNFRLIQNFCD